MNLAPTQMERGAARRRGLLGTLGAVALILSLSGCDFLSDLSAVPGPVTNLDAEETLESITLFWTDPPDADLSEIVVSWQIAFEEEDPVRSVDPGEETLLLAAEEVDPNFTQPFEVYAVDVMGNTSDTVTVQAGLRDGVAPEPVSNLVATPGNGQITVTWDDPSYPDRSADDFTVVFVYWDPDNSFGNGSTEVDPGVESYTITSLTNGTSYGITVQTMDNSFNTSTERVTSATPAP